MHGGILDQVSVKTILGMDVLFSNKSYYICILNFLLYVTFTRSLATFSQANYCLDSRVLLGFEGIKGWLDGAMVLGKLPVPGRPTTRITVWQGPTALAVGAGEGCLDIFTLIYHFSPLSPSLWETARYRLKYCLKGPLKSKQPTNHRGYYIQSMVIK